MKKYIINTAVTLSLGIFTVGGIAADEYPFKAEIKARQSFMQVYAFNLGLLGAMAKGEAEYNAELATAAADNLLAAAKMNNSAMWPAGSDSGVAELAQKTRAKPENWTTWPKSSEKHQALTEALTEMAAQAGNGLDAVRANMKAVGDGCKGCHEDFRVPKKG